MTIETKFNIGDEVWTIYNNKPTRFTVGSINIRVYTLPESWKEESEVLYNSKEQFSRNNGDRYYLTTISIFETKVFSTKQDLINSL